MDVYDFLVLATLAAFLIYLLYRWFNIARNKFTKHEPIDNNASLTANSSAQANAAQIGAEHTAAEVEEVQLTPTKPQPIQQTDVQSEIQSENELLTTLTENEVGKPANSSDYEFSNANNDGNDEADEDIDIGDMTIDVSEMLKELNLRESDSPRLDIDETQYKQLKTGEPGEVSPDTIEDVADKLRNMLH